MTSTTYISIRELQRNYKQVSQQVQASREPVIVMSKNKPQFVLMSIDMMNKLSRTATKSPAQSLLELGTWSEQHQVTGPSDLSTQHDTYLNEEYTG